MEGKKEKELLLSFVAIGQMWYHKVSIPPTSRLHHLMPLMATWEASHCLSWVKEVLESQICLCCGQACECDGS